LLVFFKEGVSEYPQKSPKTNIIKNKGGNAGKGEKAKEENKKQMV
jgi:hypothetical protein